MTMPTGPFPLVSASPMLYDQVRTRAQARKLRTATLVASAAAVIGGGGAVGLTQLFSATSTKAPLVIGAQVVPPTDNQLLALTPDCDSTCTVVGRVQTDAEDTFAVIGRIRAGGVLPSHPAAVSFVVAHGNVLVSALNPPPNMDTYAETPRADNTGNVIVPVDGGNNSLWYLPFRIISGRLALVQGTFAAPAIVGDVNSGIVDIDHNGSLEIVTVSHEASSVSGQRVYTFRSWSWNGSAYESARCLPRATPAGGLSPCGLAAYPS